ncbi:MAG: DNA polymerase III subunit beta [Chloroflexi bacterium]|nr:DNA polymerase III subunit beta [Chloroflexota bacterium]
MQLTCLPEKLAEGLATVGRVVSSKSTLPVLANILLQTDGGQLKLAATNLDLAVSCWVGAKVDGEGAITLPARLLADYVGLLSAGEPLRLELRGTKVHLACGRFEANISGIDAEEFPPVPTVTGGASFSVPAGTLKEAIQQVVFAAAADDSRPVLAGVLVTVREGTLTLAAADGFRLAVRKVKLDAVEREDGGAPPPLADLSMIVPARALTEVARGLPGDDELVTVALTADQSQVLFRHKQAEVVSRLIEGQFPDFNRIIPREAKTRVTVQTADFLRATKAAQVFARDNSMIVRLDLVPSEGGDEALGKVVVQATSSEIGDNTGDVDASVEGEAQQVAFNGRYLRDALEALDAQQAFLEVTGPASPGVLRPASGPNGYLHVIMPMHVAR